MHVKILLGLIFLLLSAAGQIFDEAASNALIEEIDAESRTKREDEEDYYDHGHAGHEDHDDRDTARYTEEWVAQITGGLLAAEELADRMGYEIIQEV